jgi:hypothetical protein
MRRRIAVIAIQWCVTRIWLEQWNKACVVFNVRQRLVGFVDRPGRQVAYDAVRRDGVAWPRQRARRISSDRPPTNGASSHSPGNLRCVL